MIKALQFTDIPDCVGWWRDTPSAYELVGGTALEVEHTDTRYLNRVFGHCLDSNCSYVSYENGKVTGMALGMVIPNVLIPSRKDLHLLALHSTNKITTGKLFFKWLSQAETLNYRIIVDELPSHTINYEKHGFKLLRKSFIKETE